MVEKTWVVIETEKDLLRSIKEIHSYLDLLKEQGKKERLALDIETYICKEAREMYDYDYSLKKQTKKQKESGKLVELQAPEYPVPYPCVNSEGIIEGRIRLIQIGLDPRQCDLQYLFDLDKIYEDYCKTIYESNLVSILTFYKDLAPLLEPIFNRASILGQFLKYEARNFIGHMDLYIPEMRDLWIMSKVRYAGNKSMKEHNLAKLYERLVNETLFIELTGRTHKEYAEFKEIEQKSSWHQEVLTEEQYQYAAEDVKLPWYVFDTLYPILEDWARRHDTGIEGTGIFEIIKLECELINPIALMENTGFPFSVEEYEAEAKPLITSKMQEAVDAVNATAPDRTEYVVKQRKKVQGKGKNRTVEHWEETVAIPHPYKLSYFNDIRALTGLDDKVLEKTSWKDLMFFRNHPYVNEIIQFKKWQKLHGYFESKNPKSVGYLKVLGSDGFIRSSFNQLGADTGRFSGMAPNLQQVPGKPFVRRCFKAPRGYKFLVGDIPQAEPRLTAQEAADPFYLDIFQSGKDMHWETGKSLFDLGEKPDKLTPEQVEMRKHSKTVRLAKTYMMGFPKFIRELYIKSEGAMDYAVRGKEGEKECRDISYRFDNLSPAVKEYIANLQREIEEPVKARGGMITYTNGAPIYVAKSILGRTREFGLDPYEKQAVKCNKEDWDYWKKVWVQDKYDEEGRLVKEGYWSANMNLCRSKLREIAREAFNNRMQASQADGFKCGILEAWKELNQKVKEKVLQSLRDCVMINVIHDEAIYLVKEELAEVMAPILSAAYTKGFRRVLWDTSIPLEIEFKVCDNWAEKDD